MKLQRRGVGPRSRTPRARVWRRGGLASSWVCRYNSQSSVRYLQYRYLPAMLALLPGCEWVPTLPYDAVTVLHPPHVCTVSDERDVHVEYCMRYVAILSDRYEVCYRYCTMDDTIYRGRAGIRSGARPRHGGRFFYRVTRPRRRLRFVSLSGFRFAHPAAHRSPCAVCRCAPHVGLRSPALHAPRRDTTARG